MQFVFAIFGGMIGTVLTLVGLHLAQKILWSGRAKAQKKADLAAMRHEVIPFRRRPNGKV